MIAGKNFERALIRQRIRKSMQIRTEEDVLEVYKNTDQITRNQMWVRFPAFRKAFKEMDDSDSIDWQVSEIIPLTEWYKKEMG